METEKAVMPGRTQRHHMKIRVITGGVCGAGGGGVVACSSNQAGAIK